MSLEEQIKSEAHRLGFQLVGVTTSDPPPHIGVFEDWLEAGRHGEMGYLTGERSRRHRADPRHILPECRAILVLGMCYPASQANPPGQDAPRYICTGRVASYAWGDDYHEVLPARLKSLMLFIEAQFGHPISHRGYTDTGPLLERDLAQRAGLGWIGKNTCLINPAQGSYFFLAEILLGIELEPDPPFLPDRCGACTRCLDACPTGCILPDRTIDARRCISYLTIELKGLIPPDLRPQIGQWVFGCDVCQQVCPWNERFASPHVDSAFAPRPGLPAPHLIQELSLVPKQFNQKFKRNPVQRAKRRGYLRNVALALGNCADPAAVSALAEALLNDPDQLVRGHSAWSLGQISSLSARQALNAAARSEAHTDVLTEIHAAMDKAGVSS